MFRLARQLLLHFAYSKKANELSKKLCFKRKQWLLSEGLFILQSPCEGHSDPPGRKKKKLQWRFEAVLVLPYTFRFTKNTVTPQTGCAMNINGCWIHSTKQAVKDVHAWLCSTWPTQYIHFNGIMNTQDKGIVHDSKLLCTMHDLCHWISSMNGL